MRLSSARATARVCVFVLLIAALVPAYAQTFPNSGWLPLTQLGSVLGDPSGDESPTAKPYLDVVGDTSNAAAAVASDANYLYLRMRVAANPLSPINHHFLKDVAWTCLLDSDADPTTYELLTALDGIATGASVELYRNTTTVKADSLDDAAETPQATYAVSTNAEALDASSTLGGGADYFADWAVAWSDLAAAGLAQGAPFRLVCGSSTTQASLTAGDVLNNSATPATSLSATLSDTLICADAGCRYDAVFVDGFEGR